MDRSYWTQRANKWVSFSVLAGGLCSALILYFVQKVEAESAFLDSSDEINYYLGHN